MTGYKVEVCEDTGKPALYKRTEHGGGPAWLLIAHVDDFFEIHKVLADKWTTPDNCLVSP